MLRLVKKCPPAPYPARKVDGLDVRRSGRRWLLEHTERGRTISFTVSREQLEDFVGVAASKLAMDREDV